MYVTSLLFGILGALGALGLELGYLTILSFSSTPQWILSFSLPTLIVFSCIEEAVKFLMLFKLLQGIRNISLTIAPSLLYGIGFAAAEIVLAMWKNEHAITWLSMQSLSIFFIHTLLALLLGLFIFFGRRYSYWFFLVGFILACIIHSSYNSILFITAL